MFVQYLFELNIKFVQYYVCVNVSCFVCLLTKIKKMLIYKFVNDDTVEQDTASTSTPATEARSACWCLMPVWLSYHADTRVSVRLLSTHRRLYNSIIQTSMCRRHQCICNGCPLLPCSKRDAAMFSQDMMTGTAALMSVNQRILTLQHAVSVFRTFHFCVYNNYIQILTYKYLKVM